MAKIGLYIINFMYSDFIPWCLNSVKKQTRQPDFIVFIDDASTDDSIEIVKKYYGDMKIDSIVVNEQNMGTAKTLNKAAQICGEAGCDFICGLSTDDMLHPDYLKETEKLLLKAKKDIGYVYTWVRRIGEENQIDIHPKWSKALLMKTPYVHAAALMKYAAYKSVGGFPEDCECQEDYELYKNMATAGWKGLLLPKAIFYWRRHNQFTRTLYGNKSGKIREAHFWRKTHEE